MSRGQSLVELAVSAPVLVLLAFGSIQVIQVVEAQVGLDTATRAAAAEAASAPNSAVAQKDAEQRFDSLIAGYPIHSTELRIAAGGFNRTDSVTVTSSGRVDAVWAAGDLAAGIVLRSSSVLPLEPWRTHSAAR